MAVVTASPFSCSGAAYCGVSALPPSSVSADSPVCPSDLQKLGDSKVEKLRLAIRSHQYVRRLQVTMHNEIGMCLFHGVQCIEEQPDTRSDIQPVLVAVAINVVALNVLKNKKGLPAWRHSCINQFRDVGMSQATQNAAFAFEPLLADLSHQRDVENLHRYAPLKSSVVSFRQPDGAHSTMTDLRNQSVDTKRLTSEARRSRQINRALVEKTFRGQFAVLLAEGSRVGALEWGSRPAVRRTSSSARRQSFRALRRAAGSGPAIDRDLAWTSTPQSGKSARIL